MRRRQILVIATAAMLMAGSVLRTVLANETPAHPLISATARQPQHPVFSEHWGRICKETKTPDENKDITHASQRWEHCRNAFNGATNAYAKDRQVSANNLGHSMHYLQDNLAPRGDVSSAVHGEMIEQATRLRGSKSAQLAFYRDVEEIKADLQSKDNLEALFNEAGERQSEMQSDFNRRLITLAPIGERAKDKYPFRCRSLAELSLDDRNEFNSKVTKSMAINAAFTERAYELYLEKVDPGSTKDLRWEFNQSGLDDALNDKDLQELINKIRGPDGQPAAVATAIRKPPLDDLPGNKTGPAEGTREETTTETTEPATTPPDTVTDTTRPEESDELLPVVARGGPWKLETADFVTTLAPIVLRINKDRTAKLSGGQIQGATNGVEIMRVDHLFGGASGDAIEVDRDHPEIAIKMTFAYTVSGKGLSFIGEEVQGTQVKGKSTVTRQADGTWLVKGINFNKPLVLKPVSVP